MNLLFDLYATQPNATGKRHGGGRYGEIVFCRMLERGIRVSCFYDSRKWLNPNIANICTANGIAMYDLKDNDIESIVKQADIDRLYSCLPEPLNLGGLRCCEVYGTIHGLRVFEIPYDDYFYRYRTTFRDKVKYCRVLRRLFIKYKRHKFAKQFVESPFRPIVVSKHTLCSLMAHFPEMAEKNIPVLYSPNTSTGNKVEKEPAAEKYFMLVSGNRWEKNNLRAIMAFDRLVSRGYAFDIRMKITGGDARDFKYKIQNPDRFEFLGYVDDTELERLYANAYLFVYPSLNEGFGYPPLEAMSYSVPVIASPFASISEICAGGALYFNPFSVEEIMNRMLMMITDSELHRAYAQNGYEQYKRIRARQDKDLDTLIDLLVGKY